MNRRENKFEPGTIVLFDPNNFNQDWWNSLSEKDRINYYGALGYGQEKPKLFVFMTEILNPDGQPSGHCVLSDLSDGHLEVMRHTSDFRKATWEVV